MPDHQHGGLRTLTLHGTQIDSLTTTHGFKHIISYPTHILPQSSSCIDLIFKDQPNYLIDGGTYPSLHSNYHHQITFCKLNPTVPPIPPMSILFLEFQKIKQ